MHAKNRRYPQTAAGPRPLSLRTADRSHALVNGSLDPALAEQRLLDVGLGLLLEHGYHALGIQALLAAGGTPKGSFYHHFTDKEDFALQVIDEYLRHVHSGLADCLADESRPPLQRVRHFSELTESSYQGE